MVPSKYILKNRVHSCLFKMKVKSFLVGRITKVCAHTTAASSLRQAHFKASVWGFGLLLMLGSVDIRMSKAVEDFYKFIWAKLTTCGEARCQMPLENYSFAVSFIHLELRRELRNTVWTNLWEKARQGNHYDWITAEVSRLFISWHT